eukprot:COSAG02_NODE_3580_length_6533_cov_1.657600_2_plen_65_part_00
MHLRACLALNATGFPTGRLHGVGLKFARCRNSTVHISTRCVAAALLTDVRKCAQGDRPALDLFR